MTLAMVGLLPLALSQPARAATVSLHLYVSPLGWSFTPGAETLVGPTISERLGDQVEVTLTSEDPNPLFEHALVINYPDPKPDFVSPAASGSSGSATFTVPQDIAGDFPYYDLNLPTNGGTWVTTANRDPTATILAPVAGTSWTAGKQHDISLNVSDLDGDPVDVVVTYSYRGGANQPIASFRADQVNTNNVPWTPAAFTATDTVIHVTLSDLRGGTGGADSPAFEVDNTAPTILSFSPGSNAIQVDRNTLVYANWSEAMNTATSGAPSAFGMRGAGGPWLSGTVSWSTDRKQITFRPADTLSVGTVYEVYVNSTATDHSDPGNLYAGSTWRFSTGSTADRTPPSILAMAADPSVQVVNGFVNLTTDVQDNVGILTVTADVRGPGFDENLTMVYASGTQWYVNRTYGAAGHYAFTVWATDSSGNVRSQTAGFDMSPTGLGGVPAPLYVNVSMTDGVVDVTWSPVSSPTLAGYYVYRGNGTAGQYTRLTITPIPKAAQTLYHDSSVQPGHTYFYTVTSVNTTGAESGYEQAISVTIQPYTTPPLFDPVPWAVAGVTLGVILGALYGMVWRRRPA